jgi:hypothetical protein
MRAPGTHCRICGGRPPFGKKIASPGATSRSISKVSPDAHVIVSIATVSDAIA